MNINIFVSLLCISLTCVSTFFLFLYTDTEQYVNCTKICEDIKYNTCLVKTKSINDNIINYPKIVVLEYNSTIQEFINEKILYKYKIGQEFQCYYNETSKKIEYKYTCLNNVCDKITPVIFMFLTIFISLPMLILVTCVLFTIIDNIIL